MKVSYLAKPSFVSLFSGCGGLDSGFMAAGFRPLAAFDNEQSAVCTYNYNLPPVAVVSDISKWSRTPREIPRPTLVLAGPPCQGFSTIGNRNPDDIRNWLLLKPIEIAIATRAHAVLLENVPGALAGSHASYWHTAVARLREAGYTTETLIVNSGTLGLPQIRRRAILFARRGKKSIPAWKAETAVQASIQSVLPVPDGTANHTPRILCGESRAGKIARYIGQGQKLCNVRAGCSSVHTWHIPEVFGATSAAEREILETVLRLRRQNRKRSWGDADPVKPEAITMLLGKKANGLIVSLLKKGYLRRTDDRTLDLTHTFNGKFRRLSPTSPTNCVITKFCQPSYFLHPYEQRAFTVREAARLQGFDDEFLFLGSERSQASQVGNAVPPPLALRLAEWVMETL